ncbi:hypothetical protein ABET51_04030 [Metabacillus fastidiosus]|uniref:hypothetical protein n=1 Tax=Metabacillus fastidiosus TaxID=1458 RepID=UPI002E203C65|nr:hypothetical protein [Metabacillus fastidiosus]
MNNKSERYIPLVVTVGQVAIFPYYILWLKEVSLTFTLFAWFFAIFSFSAAWGYWIFQSKKNKHNSYISFIYTGMGCVYILIGCINNSFEILPYVVLPLQVILGLLQGYFRAWHIKQKTYHLHTVHHYLIVGFMMIGFSFVKIISPVVFITIFGLLLCICGFWDFIRKKKVELI